MKKTPGNPQSGSKQRRKAKGKQAVWSIEKASVLRRPPSLPRAGDCSCCSGK